MYGDKLVDGGNYLFTDEEKLTFLEIEPDAKKYFRPILSGEGYINGTNRWVLFLESIQPNELKKLPLIKERIENVKKYRLASPKAQTKEIADYPQLFAEIRQPNSDFLLIPRTSSENRKDIPIGFFDCEYIVNDSCTALPNAEIFHFGILTSIMHMTWVKYICGRLKSDYRYSNTIVYNNYPFPQSPTDKQQQAVEAAAQSVLDARTMFPDSSLADLYHPLTMPPALTKAHQTLDRAVDACCTKKSFANEASRMEFLFDLYEQYTAQLAFDTKPKKKKKAE